MNQPLLTIAIPTYNGARTIENMLNLLLPQCTNDVEVIVCDNCSTDNTGAIIMEFTKKYPFIKYVRNDSNIGADGNFLKCMRIASGEYIHLLSDDDILIENSLGRLINFLKSNPKMGLVYLSTVDFKNKYVSLENCIETTSYVQKDICTSDKKLFMQYASHYWGFVSSFVISRERFLLVKNPEQYFGTYWLQSYIHILCTDNNALLGIVASKCIGAGVYQQQANFDIATVDGKNYRKMLDFAVLHGFDKKQLDMWFINRICLIASHGIVKEKATGNIKTNKKLLFQITRKYWQSWIRIYPFIFVPSFMCKIAIGIARVIAGASYKSSLNRVGDVQSKSDNR